LSSFHGNPIKGIIYLYYFTLWPFFISTNCIKGIPWELSIHGLALSKCRSIHPNPFQFNLIFLQQTKKYIRLQMKILKYGDFSPIIQCNVIETIWNQFYFREQNKITVKSIFSFRHWPFGLQLKTWNFTISLLFN
jgi:hypothetical protein